MLSFQTVSRHKNNMKEVVCGIILLIGLASAANQTTQQGLNSTKEESSINKRYIVTLPQYNPFFYGNSQVLPTQLLPIGNDPSFTNYINNLQFGISPYENIPRYYILPRNDYLPTNVPQQIVPQIQNNVVPSAPQAQVLPQQVPQQIVPQQQQVIQQQVFPQRVISEQVIPQQTPLQQIVPQKVIPQRITPQQAFPQQLAQPQQIIPQQIVPQQVVPQQIVPQQAVPQQAVPQQVIPQQVTSQQLLPQNIVPQRVVQQQIQSNIPTFPSQQIISPIRHNAYPAVTQLQKVPFSIPFQHQFYHPQAPRSQTFLRNEPYPYQVPPGQYKLPAGGVKQTPVYAGVSQRLTQVYPAQRVQHFIYNAPPSGTTSYSPISYLQQNQLNVQPQPVYVNPNLHASPGEIQQVIRIGYRHPHLNQGEIVQNAQPHQTVYLNPNLYTSYEGGQQIVRIGYVHPPAGQEVVQDQNEYGPQKVKLGIPPYNVQQNEVNGYQYANNERATRRVGVDDKGLKPEETEKTET